MNRDLHEKPGMGFDPRALLNLLAGKKIFFGHQSVGYNIMSGMTAIQKNHHTQLRVVEGKDATIFDRSVFAHAPVGTNFDPGAKIDHFGRIMRQGPGNLADIAFFKFCYVDIISSTDVDALFRTYARMMDHLAITYPRTRFLHVTVPLQTQSRGIGGFLKQLMHKEHNVKRNAYNRLLKAAYDPADVFDLAAFESTKPDGSREEQKGAGTGIWCLAPEYTEDGGHLNERGSEFIALRFLAWLAEAAR